MTAATTSNLARTIVRPRGGWRVFGRIVAFAVAAVSLALVMAAIPAQLSAPGAICSTAQSCVSGQLNSRAAATLSQHGISLYVYVIASTIIAVGSALVWFTAGSILLARRPDDRVALLVGMQAFTQGASNAASYFTDPHSVWFYLAFIISNLNPILLFYAFALFPSGHFVPRWLRWGALLWIAMQPIGILPGGNWLSYPLFLVAMLLLVGSQVYRYRRVSDPIQRQQAKLVVFAFATVIIVIAAFFVPAFFVSDLAQAGSLYTALGSTISTVVLLLAPISLVIAVMRYRLFDIDVIINRALVYGTLTVSLAAVYLGSVVGMQQVVRLVSGPQVEQQPVVIVLSTLLIAALFTPLRRRIQTTIDHRFYRRKYDAAKTLAAFGATLRSETDLSALSDHLVGVVEQTMRPEHVSLWLRTPNAEQMPRRSTV